MLCFSQKNYHALWQKENGGAIACFVEKQKEKKKEEAMDGWVQRRENLFVHHNSSSLSILHLSA